MTVIRITKTITLPKYRSRKVHHMQTDRMPILSGLTEGTSMAVYRHGNRGYSHSRLRCFPFPLIVPHLFVISVLLSCDSHSHAWSALMPRDAAASAMCRAVLSSLCVLNIKQSQPSRRTASRDARYSSPGAVPNTTVHTTLYQSSITLLTGATN